MLKFTAVQRQDVAGGSSCLGMSLSNGSTVSCELKLCEFVFLGFVVSP
jgi:hypothetical protein